MSSIGVIIMRVHVDDLHEGHFDIISEVESRHDKTLIVIGLSQNKCTVNNPLDYDTRRRMIRHHFPNITIKYIEDVYSDEFWSETLDNMIDAFKRNIGKVILYGSRDSFIKHYYGKYETVEIQQRVHISGTQVRKNLALQSRDSKDFRAGAIWFALNQYPSAIPTVDIAFLNNGDILLGKKPKEDKFRLIGGFVQPGETYEDAAIRESKEETGLTCNTIKHERSFFVDDWRYKSEVNKITTFLFTCDDYSGIIKPDDDIEMAQWFKLDESLLDEVMDVHKEMIEYLINKKG